MGTDKMDRHLIDIAEAEAKIAALQEYVASIKKALALGALGQVRGDISPVSGIPQSGSVQDLPRGIFLGKSVPAAIKLYLSAIKKKQTNKEIAAALKDGGMESLAGNFETVVAGTLYRLKESGEVLRFKDGWGLAELYSESLRNRVAQEQKPKKRKNKQKQSPVKDKEEGLQSRIEKLLASEPGKRFSCADVTAALGVNGSGMSLILGKLAKQSRAEKCGDGKYRAPSKSNTEHLRAV